MGESNKLADFGGMECSIGGMGGWSGRDIHLPEMVGGSAAVPGQDGGVAFGHSHGMFGEGGCAVSITELANGKQGRVEAVKDVSFGGGGGQAGNGKAAAGMGNNGGAVGHGHRDGQWVSKHIRKATCGGRKEMAGGASVSNDRFGRGINGWGHDMFS